MAPELDLDRLIDRWRGPLVGLFAGWGAPWGAARELAQDAFAELYVSRGRFEGDFDDPGAVGPWLRGIARNLYRGWSREQAERGARVELAEPATEPREEDPRLEDLRTEVARLPEPERLVISMFYLEGNPVRTVAALLGVTEKAVEGRLGRARRRLGRAMTERSQR